MYMYPTVTCSSNGSPVRPLNSVVLPDACSPLRRDLSTSILIEPLCSSCQRTSASSTSATVAPSNTGVATYTLPALPSAREPPLAACLRASDPSSYQPLAATQPRWVSRI